MAVGAAVPTRAARPQQRDGNYRARDYFKVMAQRDKPASWVTIALVAVPLFAILAAAGWYAARAWVAVSGPPMPAVGYLAMAIGVVFSLVVGCGLMALLFYSNRHGYDEPYQADEDRSE
jgi:fatty acid desaturase